MNISFTTVTWYSKLGAILLFLLVVPTVCFFIGQQYELTKLDIQSVPAIGVSAPRDASWPEATATGTSSDGLSTVGFSSVTLADAGPDPFQNLGAKPDTIALGTGTDGTSLQIIEVCDVRFERQWSLQNSTNYVTFDMSATDATIRKIIKENPSYFTTNAANCGTQPVWKDGAAQKFYADMTAGKTGPISQEWYTSFDGELAKIIMAKTTTEAAAIVSAEKAP